MSRLAALSAIGVAREFPTPGGALHVLKGVDLEVAPGEVTAVTGPSGSGKSTLLHILGGMDRPTSGVVRWQELEVTALGPSVVARERGRRVGFVFQGHHLLPELNALENLMVPGAIFGLDTRSEARRLLAVIGLGDRGDALPATLSGGERQRLAVARALVHRPGLLLADEPTGSLDRDNADAVFDLLLGLAEEGGTAVVVVTHDSSLVRRCDRVQRLLRGKLVPEEVAAT